MFIGNFSGEKMKNFVVHAATKEFYESILAVMPGHVYWLDLEGGYLGCNDQQAKSFGLKSRMDIVGKTNKDLFKPPFAQILDEVNSLVMSTGLNRSVEEEVVWPIGTHGIYLSHKVPLFDEYHRVIGMVGISVDITERKRSEAREKEIAKELEAKAEKEARFSLLAAQVAHDIRSPLAALEIVTKQASEVPEKQRIVIRSSISSIRDIANNLLGEYQMKTRGSTGLATQARSVVLLLPFVESIISEKRLQFEQKNILLNLEVEPESAFVFIELNTLDFKRLLSNLINNSAEAMEKGGSIILRLSHKNRSLSLAIIDTGKGIPPEILDRLFHSGASFGKSQGSGLGLIHAKESVESWGGKLSLTSTLGVGTEIQMTLPLAKNPAWFLDQLSLSKNALVLILDDDPSMHDAWEAKLSKTGLSLLHFKNAKEIFSWQKTVKPEDLERLVLLSDYELIGSEETGLDVIEQTGLRPAILVTSYFEDEAILQRCINLGIKLVPKTLVAYLPVQMCDPDFFETLGLNKREGIFLEDMDGLQMAWEMHGASKGVKVHGFLSYEDYLNSQLLVDLRTPVFIDLNFGEERRGWEIAKKFHEQGFQNLYISTGEKLASIVKPEYVKAILGKQPPF